MKPVLCLLCILLSLGGYSQITRLPSKGVLSVPSTSFYPDVNLGYRNGNAGDANASGDAGTASRLSASVMLPHGVTVDSVRVFYVDYNKDNGLMIALMRYDNATSSGLTDLFVHNTTEFSSSVKSAKPNLKPFTVDNEKHSYYLLVSAANGWQGTTNYVAIRSVVIYYH